MEIVRVRDLDFTCRRVVYTLMGAAMAQLCTVKVKEMNRKSQRRHEHGKCMIQRVPQQVRAFHMAS